MDESRYLQKTNKAGFMRADNTHVYDLLETF